MPITAAEMVTRLTTTAGAAGDATAGSANTSLGKYASTTAWAGGTLHDLFDAISGSENAANTVDYRALALLNNNATLTATLVRIYVASEVAGGASVALATDNIAASAKGSAGAQLAQIATETTAPTGVSAFSAPTTDATGLDMGTIANGQVRGLWIRRTAANTAAVDNDGFTLGIAWDSPA